MLCFPREWDTIDIDFLLIMPNLCVLQHIHLLIGLMWLFYYQQVNLRIARKVLWIWQNTHRMHYYPYSTLWIKLWIYGRQLMDIWPYSNRTIKMYQIQLNSFIFLQTQASQISTYSWISSVLYYWPSGKCWQSSFHGHSYVFVTSKITVSRIFLYTVRVYTVKVVQLRFVLLYRKNCLL